MSHSGALLVRRIIAIVLMALTVVLLFWPSFFISTFKTDWYEQQTKDSVFEIRNSMTENIDYQIDNLNHLELYEDEPLLKTYTIFNFVMVFFMNVAFFGLIALALMAIILMLFNRSKAATVLHSIFSFLTVAVFIAYIVMYMFVIKEQYTNWNETFELMVYPGVAMILLPLFSLAACILYKRDRSYPGALPKKAAQPAYASAYAPQQPTPEQTYAPQQPVTRNAAPDEWICPSCNAKNDPSEPFCPYCGTQNPAPAVKEPAAVFCTNCGTKQNPGASFCPKCGAKLN